MGSQVQCIEVSRYRSANKEENYNPMSHNQNFKNPILDYLREALAFFDADEADGIDEHTCITPVRQEHLNERFPAPILARETGPVGLGGVRSGAGAASGGVWPDGQREAMVFILE